MAIPHAQPGEIIDDVAGESLPEAGLAHSVPAIFHHHGLSLVALHVGQGLRKDGGVAGKGLDIGHFSLRAHRGAHPIEHPAPRKSGFSGNDRDRQPQGFRLGSRYGE